MLYVFYRINAMLNPYGIFIWLHEVMDNTTWLSYYQARTRPEQRIADYKSHLHVIKGLEILWNWLRNRYLVEAMVQWRHLKLYSSSLDRLPFPHSYEDQQPGNKGPFYHNRGIHPDEVEPTLENAPQVANAMLEALAHHNRQQSDARDCQEYQWQQDNTESPMADFPSPMPVDRDEPTDLEGLEDATVAPSPSSSTTTAPPLSGSAMLAPTKKKISLQEYNHHNATEQQWASTYLNRDENGEDLDYDDFKPQDDPANFQIGYQTPMPVPQASDLPPLQDASTPVPQPATTLAASDMTTPMPQHSTGPGTIPGMTAHNVATAANRAPSFGRGLPVARALPMQVGTPQASASPMQVPILAASPHRTPGHVFAAEEALLQGATLPCSPRQEAHLLNPPIILTDNHIKMMDTLRHLDSYCLQFICESAEALQRERTPTQAPPGYCMPQASDTLQGSISHPPLSQEFYRATSKQLWSQGRSRHSNTRQRAITLILKLRVRSLKCTSTNKCQACHLQTAITTYGEGAASATPSSHTTFVSSYHSPSRVPSGIQQIEDQRLKTIAHSPYLHTVCFCTFVFLFGFLYYCTACVLFRVPCKYFHTMQFNRIVMYS